MSRLKDAYPRTILPATVLAAVAIAGCSSEGAKPITKPRPSVPATIPGTPHVQPAPSLVPGPKLRPECIGGVRDWGVTTLQPAQIEQLASGKQLPEVTDELTHGKTFVRGHESMAVEFPSDYRDLQQAMRLSRNLASMIGYKGPIDLVHERVVPEGEIIARTGVPCAASMMPQVPNTGEAA